MDRNDYPKIRWPLDINYQVINGQGMAVLSCPLGISQQKIYIFPAALAVLNYFDGRHSKQEIVKQFFDAGLTLSMLEQLINLLADNLYLENDAFFEAKQNLLINYHKETVRQALLAGKCYPNKKRDLMRFIDEYLEKAENKLEKNSNLKVLISPHIDYQRGGEVYGETYKQLIKQKHDYYVVFGICHAYTECPFILTKQQFKTPLGIQPTNNDFIERLSYKLGLESHYSDENLHRNEHSIELQLPFITRLSPKVPIVPIIVGGYHFKMLQNQDSSQEYVAYIKAIVELLKEDMAAGKNFCFLDAVDMSHIGRHFGDDLSLTEYYLSQVQKLDYQFIQAIEKHDKNMLFEHIRKLNDKTHICGFPAIYATLDIFEQLNINLKFKLLKYKQVVDFEAECAVTIASMIGYVY